MAIPPFPSQDLAKLVLGYLAEEQLMTAYDEFLQASPYLDAMHNEYDRIFMTSLKNILADYRAIKIYVETCKPFLLRKKLFQCVNLLEIVKFLVNNIDVNKLCAQDIAEKNSLEKQNVSFKPIWCEVCISLKMAKCVCKGKQNKQTSFNDESTSQPEECSLQNSIETTSLVDLPGNHVKTRKKQPKKFGKKNALLQTSVKNVQNITKPVDSPTNCSTQQSLPKNNIDTGDILNNEKSSALCINSNVQPTCVRGSIRNLKECNNPHLIKDYMEVKGNNSVLENKGISNDRRFQDFASGVRAGGENRCATVPDSSTSENTNFQTPIINNDASQHIDTPRSQVVFKIEPVTKRMLPQVNTSIATVTTSYSKIKPKNDEQRIKILSDIKVDNTKNSNEKKLIPALRNATSTPLMQMQTIVINGTPAYRPHPITAYQQNFTKDEIMAMPTIIVVPASGPSQSSTGALSKTTCQHSNNVITVQHKPTDRVLSPLVIDVSPNSVEKNDKNYECANVALTVENEVGLVKTVDIIAQHKMTSLPKDSHTTSTTATSTPPVLPPLRKSSSTPRRTSHVRVLDFATPRRILHETISEQGADQVSAEHVDIVPAKSLNLILSEQIDFAIGKMNNQKGGGQDVITKSAKDSIEINKKSNWDDDLRAMIAKSDDVLSKTKVKSRLKITKKKKTSTKKSTDKDDKNYDSEKNCQDKKRKKRQILEEEDEPDLAIKPVTAPIKPTINIKPGTDWGTTSTNATKKENENNQVKNNEEENIETPEVERIYLQNAIGAKLNISDLLETPYKQVFYDIQMDTPRCLGPDVPDDPMSDIKIMNIPTPRFFDSPKIVQATPSSYSSRPTDYSSGGSYYKPDDQDYLPIPDIKCPVTSSKEELLKDEINDNRTTRPVRQCAKNVSYYTSNKIKDSEDKSDIASTCSENTSSHISHDHKIDKDKTSKVNKTNESIKGERSKRSCRKKKSAVKEKPKTFMKIKPRRVTPTKETLSGKSRKRTLQSNSPKLPRKRTTSKDKNIDITAIVTSVPTKSRRKSSTPRKLNCSKSFNSESSSHNSPEISSHNKQQHVTRETNSMNTQDSDTEQLNLRWSDDGSQDVKTSDIHKNISESEDISKIQEYIKTAVIEESSKEIDTVFQTHLIKRGFDEVTAKNIERDLLDTPPRNEFKQAIPDQILEPIEQTKPETAADNTLDTDSSITNELQIDHNNTDDDDEIELSVQDSNEETNNWCFVTFNDGDTKIPCQKPLAKLKDTFSMEVCIEDGIAIRLRATSFNLLFDLDPGYEGQPFCDKEMQDAVESISNIDKLYTPLKNSVKAQCYEIFDSTLTSLDTPLKVSSPRKYDREITITEIILEEEKAETKDKTEFKKRKRLQNSNGSDDCVNESKKTKPDTQYLLASANIQNIDIESVLKKLHGP